MRTSLPVSTISYNTPDFLADALKRMRDNGEISFWAFIAHHGEGGDKDHTHVYVEPSRLRSQDDWKNQYFLEFDPQKPDKPLSVTSWRKSKWRDWYLYGLHDKLYLLGKGECKEYSYALSDFVSSDDDELRLRVSECDVPQGDSTFVAVQSCIKAGLDWVDIVRTGLIPTRNLNQAERLFVLLSYRELPKDDTDGFPYLTDSAGQGFCEGLFDC